jgi:hypothetical protein
VLGFEVPLYLYVELTIGGKNISTNAYEGKRVRVCQSFSRKSEVRKWLQRCLVWFVIPNITTKAIKRHKSHHGLIILRDLSSIFRVSTLLFTGQISLPNISVQFTPSESTSYPKRPESHSVILHPTVSSTPSVALYS